MIDVVLLLVEVKHKTPPTLIRQTVDGADTSLFLNPPSSLWLGKSTVKLRNAIYPEFI